MSSFTNEAIASVIIMLVLYSLRVLLVRVVRRNAEVLSKDQRRWINRIKNGTIVVFVLCLIMIWAPQLQTFALSLTAFAVAFVVATKEMILCLTGSLLRVSTQPYKVGDWITVDGITGEVMEINAFTTRLEEIDDRNGSYEFTGKTVSMPNSKLFTSTVEKKNICKSFVFGTAEAVVQFQDMNPEELSESFRYIVESAVAPYRDDCLKFIHRVSRKAGIDAPDVRPQYGIRTTELGHFSFSCRIFVPTKEADNIVTDIKKAFLSRVFEIRKNMAQEKEQLPIPVAH